MEQLINDLLSGESNKILRASIELANLGRASIASLLKVLETETDEKKLIIVAGVLSNIGEEAVAEIIELMKSRYDLKVVCGLILKDIGKNSVSHLLTGLLDSNTDVKAMLAEILGEIKDVRAIPHLKTLLEDDSEEVRIAASEAIKEIEKPFASRVIESIKYTSQIEKILNNISD